MGSATDILTDTNRICTGPTQFVDPNGEVRTVNDPSITTLCKVDPYWTETEIAFFTFNAVAIKRGAYTTQQALDFTNKLREWKKNNKYGTLGSFASYTLTLIVKVPELVVAQKSLQRYTAFTNLIIDDFTWYFIDKHMNDQDAIALSYQK